MPRRRSLSIEASAAAMDAAKAMRAAAVRVCTEAPITSPAYVEAGATLAQLDRLAEALTGRCGVLHDPRHTAGGR